MIIELLSLNKIEIHEKVEQRGIGDILEKTIFHELEKAGCNISKASSKRSVEDFSLNIKNVTYLYDVKSHGLNNTFSMPNLISVTRLRKIIEENVELFYIFVSYIQHSLNEIIIQDIVEVPFYHIDWSCLQIANLGKGQLQIKNMEKFQINSQQSREKWYEKLKIEVIKFYEKQLIKTEKQIEFWK